MKRKTTASKLFAILLTLTLLSGMMAVPAAAAPSDYSDMPLNWAKAPLEYAVNNGLLVGYNGKIDPNGKLTRAQMVAIVNRAFGATELADISAYTDVPSTAWYVNDIARAVKMEVLFGSNNTISPEKTITREQAFAVAARALKLSTTDYTYLDAFSDKDQISDMFKAEVAALVKEGYIVGYNGLLNPKQSITRAQFAQVMYSMVKGYVRAAGTYTSTSAGSIMISSPGVTLRNLTVSGSLIIGDGVGNGDVILDNVTVTGRTVVRGGGSNSIHVLNGSSLNGDVVINNVNREVRIVTDSTTTIAKVETRSQAILEGRFGEVKVAGKSNTNVNLKGQATSLTVETANSSITVSGTVGTLQTSAGATGARIITTPDARITTVIAGASGTQVTGAGIVSNVQAQADNVSVSTPNTSVTAGEGVAGTVVSGQPVSSGSSTTSAAAATRLRLNSVSYQGQQLQANENGVYTLSKATLSSSGGIQVSLTGQDFYNFDYTMSVAVSGPGISGGTYEQSVSSVPGMLMNQTYSQSFSSFLALLDAYNRIAGEEEISQPEGVISNFMADFDGYLSRLEPGQYEVTVKASGITVMTLKLELVP